MEILGKETHNRHSPKAIAKAARTVLSRVLLVASEIILSTEVVEGPVVDKGMLK